MNILTQIRNQMLYFADIATGLDKECKIATRNPLKVYILVEVDGEYKICYGVVYDFYQFVVIDKSRKRYRMEKYDGV